MSSWILGMIFAVIVLVSRKGDLNYFQFTVITSLFAIFMELYTIRRHIKQKEYQ